MDKTNTASSNSQSANTDSRRGFLKKGALAAAAAATLKTPVYGQNQAPSPGRVIGANDRISVGFVGVGGQGFNAHVRNVKQYEGDNNTVAVAVSDVYNRRLERARDFLGLSADNAYEDYRKLIERKDIDAIFCATVDHWHSQVSIDALNSGKHVYCEKPMTRYLDEAFAVYDVVKKTGKTFQIGSQYCSAAQYHKAAELVRAGMVGAPVLGQASYCRNNPDGEWNYGIDDTSTPENINWKRWLGKVSERPFSADSYHRWRKYYPYCAGILGDLLAHRIHPLMIASGNPEFPVRVASLGTRKITTDRDVHDNTQVLAEFPSGLSLLVIGSTVNEQGLPDMFRGHEATIYFGGSRVELRPERPFADEIDPEEYDNLEPGVSVPAHHADFFNGIRTGKPTNGNIDLAVKVQTVISMAEMAARLGYTLHFDEKTRQMTTGDNRVIQPITYGSVPLS